MMWRWIEDCRRDLRHAARTLVRTPTFTLTAVLSPALGIVNPSFARRYFGDASPIGHRIGFGSGPDSKTDVEIVGVVADFSYRGIREETEQAYFPFLDIPWSGGTFYVRTRGKPEAVFAGLRAPVARIDPALPILSMRTIGISPGRRSEA